MPSKRPVKLALVRGGAPQRYTRANDPLLALVARGALKEAGRMLSREIVEGERRLVAYPPLRLVT